jgi:hypothetical protein
MRQATGGPEVSARWEGMAYNGQRADGAVLVAASYRGQLQCDHAYRLCEHSQARDCGRGPLAPWEVDPERVADLVPPCPQADQTVLCSGVPLSFPRTPAVQS